MNHYVCLSVPFLSIYPLIGPLRLTGVKHYESLCLSVWAFSFLSIMNHYVCLSLLFLSIYLLSPLSSYLSVSFRMSVCCARFACCQEIRISNFSPLQSCSDGCPEEWVRFFCFVTVDFFCSRVLPWFQQEMTCALFSRPWTTVISLVLIETLQLTLLIILNVNQLSACTLPSMKFGCFDFWMMK